MGLFCLPTKPLEECSVEDLIQAAERNIATWRTHQNSSYLLGFATTLLGQALEKARALEQ